MKTILFVFGTRPEVIKLAPVILELKKYPDLFRVIACNTEQQKELSNQTLQFFGLSADINLDVMRPNQSLALAQSRIMKKLQEVFDNDSIDATIVQGDTLSVFCGGLVSFYNRIPVFHIEAGLRSYNLFEPFPEEAMRQMVARITDLHFAPTQEGANALIKENISPEKISVTGNTVIDALHCLSPVIIAQAETSLAEKNIQLNDKLVLLTIHRRENHGERLINILAALKELAKTYSDHNFVFSVHPNPNVKNKVYEAFENIKNVNVLEALDYPNLVRIMMQAKLVITDSGGIQEEAPTFGVPVLVARYETERKEGVLAGFAKLVGADPQKILSEASIVLSQDKSSSHMDGTLNPYGDGNASQRIKDLILQFFA